MRCLYRNIRQSDGMAGQTTSDLASGGEAIFEFTVHVDAELHAESDVSSSRVANLPVNLAMDLETY